MKQILFNPVFETLINKAVFVNQDIVVCPMGDKLPYNITNVIKFLFGEGVYLEQDVVNESACLIIKGASYTLNGARTLNASWVCREVKSQDGEKQ